MLSVLFPGRRRDLLVALTLFVLIVGTPFVRPAQAADDTLVVAIAGEPASLDPCFGAPWTIDVMYALYETPVGFVTTQSGDYEVQVVDDGQGWKPLLAERVEVGEDGRTFTFRLRRGVRFYPSGNEMTAHDWLWSWRRQLSEPAIGYCVFENHEASITDISSIEVLDDYTVRVTTDVVNPRTLPFLRFHQFAILDSRVVQRHATDGDAWATEWLSSNTAGTGPYYVASHTPGNELVLQANPYYWRDAPYFERVIIKTVPDVTTRLALLQRGDVDIVADVPSHLAERVARHPGVQLVSVPSGRRVYAGFNPQVPPFGDIRVRKAIAYAVPYDDIIAHVFNGKARRYGSFVLPGVPGYTEAGFDYDLDLDEARRLLHEAGIPQDLRIPISVDGAVQVHQDIALLLQDYLRRIGVQLDINVLPSAEFRSRRHEESLGFYIHSTDSWIDDPSTIVSIWMESDARGNRSQFRNETVDRLQREWQFRPYSPEREAVYERIQEIYNSALHAIYLALPDFILLTRHDIGGYALYKDEAIRYSELYRIRR